MKTQFSETQLSDPAIAEANEILKTCQHFGFCTSGCPTYVLTRDENEGTRGRIDLIKEMLESTEPPSAKTVMHLDHCLSCMSCLTTCAVNVDYFHLIDIARTHIEDNFQRPLLERSIRKFLGYVLPRPHLFRLALFTARTTRPLKAISPKAFRHYFDLLPDRKKLQQTARLPQRESYKAEGKKRWRVALLAGCVQPVLSPEINAATIRLLTNLGCEVIIPKTSGCCGSLNLHMGGRKQAVAYAQNNIDAWTAELDGEGLDAILINASGCGSTVKDYPHLMKGEDLGTAAAKRVSDIAMDISEWLAKIGLPEPPDPKHYRVAYHDACSLRNVQKVTRQPRNLLEQAGFQVVDVPEGHFCCGSAGTYNMLQPEMARQLGERKAKNINSVSPQIIAAGNIGCVTQIHQYTEIPIAHTIELLDWAYGGPCPPALVDRSLKELSTEERNVPRVVPLDTTTTPTPVTVSGQPDTNDDVGIW